MLALLLGSCNPAKKLQPGEYLVDKVEVVNARQTTVPREEFEAFYRQRPNRKFLRKIPFFVWWYNQFDNDEIQRRKARRNERYDRRNAERIRKAEKKNIRRASKGRRPKIPKMKDKESATFMESLRDIGEPAVVLDSMLTGQTRTQLSRYLFSKGYFNNRVQDCVIVNARRKTATVRYILHPGPAYTVSAITYRLDDPQLGAHILSDTLHRLISPGMQYDEARFRQEQERITDFARNSGYYYFENAYLNFYVDTTLQGNVCTAQLRLSQFSRASDSNKDSMVLVNHPRFRIENVYVITEPVIGNIRDASFRDTLYTPSGVMFLHNQPIAFRQFLITDNIDIYKGQLFRKDTAQQTYKQLQGLGMFKSVNVQFLLNPNYPGRLDCYIVCTPLIRQSLTAETELINTSGNRGIDGSLVYQNRNLFRAGELIEFRLQGSIAAQTFFRDQDEVSATGFENLRRTFNTIQVGPELTFSVPRAFFPFSLLPFRRHMSPRTYVKSSLNYQSRPEFSRVISAIDYGFSFRTHNNTLRHDLIPVEIYFVKATLSARFRNTLANLNDAFLVNSFQDHVTTLSRYTLTYFTKENTNTSSRTVHYVRWSVQSSGSLLRGFFNQVGHRQDTLGRYLLFGIPFAHFLRTDADYRIYIPVRKRSRMVYRMAGGIGRPLVNLNVLPYEQSFFSGGPNSVRAWRARTLGPGGYDPSNSSARFDKIGDILLEGNVEYRFHILKSFNGALFADAGNIWRLRRDDTKPGGEFLFSRFADQIAIGGGFGVRWDLNFFVIRVDFAVPLKDPKFAPGNRWTFNKQPWQYGVVNFGIGYPF